MKSTENTDSIQKKHNKDVDILSKIDEAMRETATSLTSLWSQAIDDISKTFDTKSYNPYIE
jgi:hypothetical protein